MAIIVEELFARLGLRTDKATFSAGDRLINGIKAGLAGIIAFKSSKFFTQFIQDTANAADRFNKMSAQIGISSESLQGLDFAAKLSGTDVEVLRNGMQRFARTADAAAQGNKTASETFKRFGVAVKDADGNLLAADVVLGKVADKIASMPDGTEKTALAIQAFGRSGGQLIPLLNAGSEGIAEMQQEFADLGGVISTKTAAGFEEFNDLQLKVNTSLTGMKNSIVSAALPALNDLLKGMLRWLKTNRTFLKQNLSKFLKLMTRALSFFGSILKRVVSVVKFFTDNMGLLRVVLASVAAAMLILKASSLSAALASLQAWLAALAPFVLLAAGIAAIILIVEDLWYAFTGGESVFKDLYLAAKKWISEKMIAILEEANDALGGLIFAVTGAPAAVLKKDYLNTLKAIEAHHASIARLAPQAVGQGPRAEAAREEIRLKERGIVRLAVQKSRQEQEIGGAAAMEIQKQFEAAVAVTRLPAEAVPAEVPSISANITVNAANNPEDVAMQTEQAVRRVLASEVRAATAGTTR